MMELVETVERDDGGGGGARVDGLKRRMQMGEERAVNESVSLHF